MQGGPPAGIQLLDVHLEKEVKMYPRSLRRQPVRTQPPLGCQQPRGCPALPTPQTDRHDAQGPGCKEACGTGQEAALREEGPSSFPVRLGPLTGFTPPRLQSGLPVKSKPRVEGALERLLAKEGTCGRTSLQVQDHTFRKGYRLRSLTFYSHYE